jgi:hypothetical protein
MDIEAYKKYWSDNGEMLYTYSLVKVDSGKVDRDTFVFLTACGLPSDAAPFLSFSQMHGQKLLTPNQIFRIDFEYLDDYLMFGSNGSGDPLCIDTAKQNEIVYLNHDNHFDRVFVNKSISQFALCLIKYRDFYLSLVDIASEDYSRREFSDQEYIELKKKLS